MIELDMFNAYIHAKEIQISSNRIEYFSHHLNRCKKLEDKIKLIAFIMIELAYTTINTTSVVESTKQIKDKLLAS